MKDLKTFLQELLSRLKQFDEINKKKQVQEFKSSKKKIVYFHTHRVGTLSDDFSIKIKK